jgi:nanoRNase/pAp phosphatase (c-di-AMP/oligoRNAs hydrolase)
MDSEVKKLLTDAKNICIIPSSEPESLTSALALFYTLKELQKNVNLMIDGLPEQLQFLVPSLSSITQPKNFVISIPRSVADVSQIYYEKNEGFLKIHLTANKGFMKKDDISFYASNPKPDAIITLGIQDFHAQLKSTLDSFGFLLDVPVINIDNRRENTKFGQVNLVEPTSVSELSMEVIGQMHAINKDAANCLLAGIISYYHNLKSPKTTLATFQLASELMKKGADYHAIIGNLSKPTAQEIHFIEHVFKSATSEHGLATAQLPHEFQDFSEAQAAVAVEKIQAAGIWPQLLVLWPSHNSDPAIKGFFYSDKAHLINKFSEFPYGAIKNGWVFLSMPGENIAAAKETIIKLI